MTHYWKINGIHVEASVSCTHPDLENNTCPIRTSPCASCKYCRVSVKAPDFFAVMDSLDVAIKVD